MRISCSKHQVKCASSVLMVCSSSVEAATWRSIPSEKESNTPDYTCRSSCLPWRAVDSDWVRILPLISKLWSRPSQRSWVDVRLHVSLPHDGEPLVGIRGWLELWLLCMVCVFVKCSVYDATAVLFCLFVVHTHVGQSHDQWIWVNRAKGWVWKLRINNAIGELCNIQLWL